ncbi:MFS transporter [Roseomonas eburnea]|uniref:MFS transporter n=1 Tax=Neoroseomonas eburnea TaxID=1346889 RepID=A0A9X9X5L1_9PROT|nr:MFS transporter [Neoroseomonas eburnea]MBR0678997.1 MFS transporter [Neoroseomonas eburnea]
MATFGTLSRALSHRNARIFFGASLTAWTGLWMHRIAVSWLAWELTGSALWVGFVAFCDLAPAVVVSPIAGAVADRADRLRLTMLSQAAIGLNAALIAILVATGWMTIGLLLVLEVVGGTAASFAQPARQSLMPGLVPRADLPAAVALNSLTFNVARFIGPALAGPLIAVAGVWPAIAMNALAYLVATATTPMLRVEAAARRGHAATASLLGETLDGIRYAARHPGLGPILTFAAVAALLLRGVQEILPPYVERTFGLGAGALAVLTASFGVGALVAGLAVAARGRMAGTTRLAVLGVAALAFATAGFVATGWFPLGVLCAAFMGAAGSVHGISVQTVAQNASDPAMRGRVLSLWGLITRACPALGALLLGAAGEIFGLRWPTLVAVALSLLAVGWGLARLPRMAPELEGGAAGR